MKIMAYYLDLGQRRDTATTKELIDAKKLELKVAYPTLNIMVLPSYTAEGDHIDVIDMYAPVSPYYPQHVYGGVVGTQPPYMPMTTGVYPKTAAFTGDGRAVVAPVTDASCVVGNLRENSA